MSACRNSFTIQIICGRLKSRVASMLKTMHNENRWKFCPWSRSLVTIEAIGISWLFDMHGIQKKGICVVGPDIFYTNTLPSVYENSCSQECMLGLLEEHQERTMLRIMSCTSKSLACDKTSLRCFNNLPMTLLTWTWLTESAGFNIHPFASQFCRCRQYQIQLTESNNSTHMQLWRLLPSSFLPACVRTKDEVLQCAVKIASKLVHVCTHCHFQDAADTPTVQGDFECATGCTDRSRTVWACGWRGSSVWLPQHQCEY